MPIDGSGVYSANLSNLTNGTLAYLLSVKDPSGNVIKIDPTVTLGDGSANAPPRFPQAPNLLSGETVRPTWMVAGVDYRVGIYPNTGLKNPAIVPLPAGCEYSSNYNGGPCVIVNGANNVVLNGWNFSGVNVYISNVSNTTIENSYFSSTAPAGIIYTDALAHGLTVENCVLDGRGTTPKGGFDFVYAVGGGNINFEYNLVENYQSGVVAVVGRSNITYKYNLIENGATYPGQHLNVLELCVTKFYNVRRRRI